MPCVALNATNAAVTAAKPTAKAAIPWKFRELIADAMPLNTVDTMFPTPENADLIAFPIPLNVPLTVALADLAILTNPLNGLISLGIVNLSPANGFLSLNLLNMPRLAISVPVVAIKGAKAAMSNLLNACLIASIAGCACAFSSLNFLTTVSTALLTTFLNFSEC